MKEEEKKHVEEENILDNEETAENPEDMENSEKTENAENSEDSESEEEKDLLEAAQEEIEQLKDKYLRSVAEFDNYRKRTLKEKAELILNGGEKAVQAILPVIDDMERALQNGEKTDDPAAGPIYGILYGNGERSRAAEKALFVYAVNPLRLGHMAKAANFTIPRNARIVTSGLGGVFPRGLAVGHLLDGTSDDDSRLERQGVVVPAVDFTSLEYVFIRRED